MLRKTLRKTLPAYIWCVIVLLTIAKSSSAQNHEENERPGKGAGDSALTPELVKTGLYVISGGGGNSLLRLSGNGLILVDGKLPGNYEAILAQAAKLSFSDQPIRVLITTDHQENHTGNNAQFLAAGTQIIAHENEKLNQTNYHPSGEDAAPPTITYDHDYTLRLGGVEAHLMHFGNARTSGDTVVYFPNLRVVAVGDLFAPTPNPDFSAGGSLVDWGPVLAEILKLDFDVVVPGTGPMVDRAELETFKTKIDTLVSRATGLVKKGVPKNRLMAQLKTDDLGWRFSFTGGQLDRFYAELSRTK
jgi:cyclase